MAIYISKNAISKNPFVTQEIDKEEKKYPPLTTDFLKTPYLIQIMTSPKSGVYLSKYKVNNDKISVRRIKEALNFIHTFTGSVGGNIYQIPGGELLEARQINSGVFDDKLEAAVIEFQKFVGITEDGVIGPETLYHIDNFLHSFFSREDKENEILGKAINKSIMVKPGELIDDGDGNVYYLYGIRIGEKTYSYQHYGNTPMSTSPIDTMLDGKNAFIFKDVTKEEIINQNNIIEDNEQAFIRRSKMMSFSGDLKTAGLNLGIEDVESELDITPPQILPEEQAYLYLVSEGDTLMKIVEREYYNNQPVDIPNPLSDTGEAIYTLKAQTLNTDPDTREHDAKLQFYMNLLYYCNSIENQDGSLVEFGVNKSDTYTRYDNDHLLEFQMYNNTLDSNNPETALLNYYRFLKYQESKGSKIEFDNTGETTSFVMNAGKYIYIPSREFADSLYYHINFRHQEMLVETEKGYEYVADTSFIDDVIDLLSTWTGAAAAIVNFVVEETTNLLSEVYFFMKEAYAFAKQLSKDWLRGLGGELGVGLGATYGIFAGDIESTSVFYRKMSRKDEYVFVLQQNNKAFGGIDVGVGGAVGLKKTAFGKKKSNMSLGLQIGAGLKAGQVFNYMAEYELPVRQEETAVLTLLVHVFGGPVTKLAAKMAASLGVLNIDPDQYLTKMKIGLSVEANVWGASQLGYKKDDTSKPEKKKNINFPSGQITPDNSSQSPGDWLTKNIFKLFSDAGISADGSAALGSEIEFEAKYDNKPLVAQKGDRVPSQIKAKVFAFCGGSFAAHGMGSRLTRLFLSNNIAAFLNFLKFDTNYGFGHEITFNREGRADELTVQDVDPVSSGDPDSIPVTANGSKAKYGNNKATWETQALLSRFRGDVDVLFIQGNEVTLKLNTYELVTRLRNGNFFTFNTIQDVIQLVYSIEFQFKPSLLNLGRSQGRVVFAEGVMGSMNNRFNKGNRRDFIAKKSLAQWGKNGKYTGEVYAGLYAKVEFKIGDLLGSIANVIKYYIRYWYLRLKAPIEINDDELLLRINKFINNNIPEKIKNIYETFGETKDNILSKEQYEQLFVELNHEITAFYTEESLAPNFGSTALELLDVTGYLLQYLNNETTIVKPTKVAGGTGTKWEDMDIQRFTPALVSIADIVDTELFVESKLGVKIAPNISGAIGGKLRLLAMFEGALAFVYHVVENNKLIPLETGDLDKKVLTDIGAFIGIDESTGEVTDANGKGIRKSIIQLPN